jgi:hypothetical protein
MERARKLPTRSRPRIHWPRRQRAISPPMSPILLPIEHRTVGVPLSRALAIVGFGCGAGWAIAELLVGLVRWSIPL